MSMRNAVLTLAMLLPVVAHAAKPANNLWLTDADIAALRSQPERTHGLIARCDKEIDVTASPVAVFNPPPHYTTAGVVMTDMSKRFSSDGGVAYRAALCYQVTQDARYAQHAQQVISAWADTLHSVPSRQGGSEINFDLPEYVLAASMVRGAGDWDDRPFSRLLTQIALPLSHIAAKNNHANWGVFLNASIAAYTGDAKLLASTRNRWLALMDNQVAADGSLPLEICRSDTNDYCGGEHQGINGLSYTHFTLLPTTAAARIFDLQGQPVWRTPEGGKLALAYRKAAAWTLHPETFPYFERNGGQLNGVRNAAYFALLQHQYPNADGARVLAEGKLATSGLEWWMLFR